MTPNNELNFSADQIYVIMIGALVPLVTYVINTYAPWLDEKVKAVVHVVTAAVAGALYQALSDGNLGFNSSTAGIIVSSVFAALLTHKVLWAPSGISAALGGGQNRNLERRPQA